ALRVCHSATLAGVRVSRIYPASIADSSCALRPDPACDAAGRPAQFRVAMSERVSGAIDLAPASSAGSLALDLSAGHGLSTRMLQARGWRVVATERTVSRPGWVAADLISDLPFRSETFDLVLLLEVIEHLPDIPHSLREIARVLKPGGTAIVTTPNRLN